ncbi:MAG: prolyl-tRNA synthetase associated domain-containing protein [Candidatus Odyssella sp.]|nr:prolyl-tRNA synthetase associated domain-containing protein [Candidatus Odyssella sp.]
MPLAPDDLFARLAALGIRTQTVKHPPLFTVEQSKALRGELPGGHTKNLFLKDKKDRMWLVTAEEDRPIDLKALGTALGASGRVSFGSPERLMRHLGVIPGAVTPFGLVNDTEGLVSFVLDEGLARHETLNFHPLTNEATTAIARADFLRFLEAIGHAPRLLALPAREPA